MHGEDSLCSFHHRVEKYRFYLELSPPNARLRGFLRAHPGPLSLTLHLVSPCFVRRWDGVGRGSGGDGGSQATGGERYVPGSFLKDADPSIRVL